MYTLEDLNKSIEIYSSIVSKGTKSSNAWRILKCIETLKYFEEYEKCGHLNEIIKSPEWLKIIEDTKNGRA